MTVRKHPSNSQETSLTDSAGTTVNLVGKFCVSYYRRKFSETINISKQTRKRLLRRSEAILECGVSSSLPITPVVDAVRLWLRQLSSMSTRPGAYVSILLVSLQKSTIHIRHCQEQSKNQLDLVATRSLQINFSSSFSQ